MAIKGYLFFSRPKPTDDNPDPEWERLNFLPEPAEDFIIEGLNAGTDYQVASKAVDLAGNESEMSEPLDVSTLDWVINDEPLDAEDQMVIDGIVNGYIAEVGLADTVGIALTGPRGSYMKMYGTYKKLDNHFRIGSVTKSFVATAVLKAVKEGLITLDDSIGQHLVNGENYSWGNVDPTDITIRHLLMMRAGIFDYTQDSSFGLMMYLWPTSSAWNNMGQQHSLAFVRGNIWAPGRVYYYCNTNYLVLNDLLEHLYEKPAAQIIEEDICAPLGMMETKYLAGVGPPAPTMVGYGWDMLFGNMCILGGRRNQTYCNPYAFKGSGCMTSTVGDMNKWAQELRDATILGPEINALRSEKYSVIMQAGNEGGIDRFGYGLGEVSFGNYVGHDGSIMGYDCVCEYDPESHATIFLIENFQTPGLQIMSKLTPRITDYLYPERSGVPNYPRYMDSLKSAEAFGSPLVGDISEMIEFESATSYLGASTYFTAAGIGADVPLTENTKVIFALVYLTSQSDLGAWVTCGGKNMTKLGAVGHWTLYYQLNPTPGETIRFTAGISGYGFNTAYGFAFAYTGVKTIGTVATYDSTGTLVTHRVSGVESDWRVINVLASTGTNAVTNYSGHENTQIVTSGGRFTIGDVDGDDTADEVLTATVPSGAWWSMAIPVRP